MPTVTPALTTEGKGRAKAPPQPDGPARRAELAKEYVAGIAAAYEAFDSFYRSLPPWQDALARDFPGVYERMLLDPVVHASARTLKLAALSDDVTPRPAVDDADDPDFDLASELADFCADVQGGMARGVEDVWYEMLDGVLTGSRVAEKVARPQEGGKHAGKTVWDRVSPKPPLNTAFVLDAYGNLAGLLGRPPGGEGFGFGGSGLGGTAVDPDSPDLLPREKFCVFTWDPQNGDPRGRALLRPVYEPWWAKQGVLRQWLKFLATTAVPSLFATLPEGALADPALDHQGNPTSTTQLSTTASQQLLNTLIQFQGAALVWRRSGRP